jgi:hypothetical protein
MNLQILQGRWICQLDIDVYHRVQQKKKGRLSQTQPRLLKKEVKTEKKYPAMEGFHSNCEGNKHSEFGKTEARVVGSYKMLALLTICQLVPSGM